MFRDWSHDERNSSEAPYDLAQSKYLTPIAHAASRVSCACARISSMLLPLMSASWPMLMYPGGPTPRDRDRAGRPYPNLEHLFLRDVVGGWGVERRGGRAGEAVDARAGRAAIALGDGRRAKARGRGPRRVHDGCDGL